MKVEAQAAVAQWDTMRLPGPSQRFSPADGDAMSSTATAETFSIRGTQGKALKE